MGFRFPYKKNPGLAEKWIEAMQLSADKKEGKICHHHFPQSAFIINEHSSRRNLRHDAIPTIISVQVRICIVTFLPMYVSVKLN